MLFLITGGSGSGKSAYAERLTGRLANREHLTEKIYLATMENRGEEARKRIMRHQNLRAGQGFTTIESPFGFTDTIWRVVKRQENNAVILLECVSNLLANLMFCAQMTGEQAQEEIISQICRCADSCTHTVVVTNEIFSDGNLYTEETQAYLSALGRVNRRLAVEADAFCEVVYTIPVFWKGEPLCQF